MTKTLDENFKDWENDTFGFGYGTGEPHIMPSLKTFFGLCSEGDSHSYDYAKVEAALTPTVAWLLINILCKHDVLEYGGSPRFAWLTKKGEALKKFTAEHTADELINIACDHPDDYYVHCYPNACNCGQNGYEEGKVCPNPFWQN